MNCLVDKLVARMPSRSVYPAGVVEPITPKVRGRSFFPGGSGLFNGAQQQIPDRPLMLVGQDFGNVDYWSDLGVERENEDGTWAGVRKMLGEVDIDPEKCFFTNALLGVRVSRKITGPSPGLVSSCYLAACMDFWEEQVRIVQPRAVVSLGVVPTLLLARRLAIMPCVPVPTPKYNFRWKEIDALVEPFVPNVRIRGAPSFAFATSVHPLKYWLNTKLRTWSSRGLFGSAAHDSIWKELANMCCQCP